MRQIDHWPRVEGPNYWDHFERHQQALPVRSPVPQDFCRRLNCVASTLFGKFNPYSVLSSCTIPRRWWCMPRCNRARTMSASSRIMSRAPTWCTVPWTASWGRTSNWSWTRVSCHRYGEKWIQCIFHLGSIKSNIATMWLLLQCTFMNLPCLKSVQRNVSTVRHI